MTNFATIWIECSNFNNLSGDIMISKKVKTLAILIIGVLSSVFFVGCSCSKKEIKPTGITVDVTEHSMYVGDTIDINYSILPVDTTKHTVNVTVSKLDVVSFNTTTFDGITGKLTVTAANVDKEGVVVTFTIAGTNLKATTNIKVLPDPIKLGTPLIVGYSNARDAISFKNVVGTKKYLINIDGTEYEYEDPTDTATEHYVTFDLFNADVPLTYNEQHIFKVKAVGDGIDYVDGEYSEEYKFLKYSPITNLQFNNGEFTWDAHELAPLYAIKINGVEQTVMASTNSYILNPKDAGEYKVEIAATTNKLYDNDDNMCRLISSNFSEEYVVYKLGTPTLALNNLNEANNTITNTIIEFPAISGATGYKVTISPAVNEQTEFVIDTNAIEIDDDYVAGTKYTMTVTPLGDVSNTISGGTGSIQFTKIAKVTNTDITNNVLTFDGITEASKYAIIVRSDNDCKYILTTSTTVDLAESLSVVGTYTITIRAIGTITDVINMANGEVLVTSHTFTKLGNTQIEAVRNNGYIAWDTVDGCVGYNIFLDDTYLTRVTENNYTLPTGSLSAGRHTIKIVAVGDGINSITSGKSNASEYEFFKLEKPTNLAVLDDTLTFDNTTNAVNYSVKINNGSYRLIGKSETTQSYKIDRDIIGGDNTIFVIAEGDNVKYISSDASNIVVPRLQAPTNIRIENGNLVWNKIEGYTYKVYIGEDQEVLTTEDNVITNLFVVSGQQTVKIKAILVGGSYLSSDYATKTIVKLESVDSESIKTECFAVDNEKSNYRLVWDSVENAVSYSINITGVNNAESIFNYNNITTTFYNLPEAYSADKYNVTITAVGSTASADIGYINATPTSFEFTKLSKPTDLAVVNGVLTWKAPTGVMPTGYKLGIKYGDNEEIFVDVTLNTSYTFDLSSYGLEEIVVRIRSLGDNVNMVTGEYCTPITFSRNTAITNFKIINGVITWDKPAEGNFTYLVYGTTTPDIESSYSLLKTKIYAKENTYYCELTDIEDSVQYSIKVVVTSSGSLDSQASSILKATKLPPVSGFKMVNRQFVWDASANATGYIVDDGSGNNKPTTNTTLSFDEFAKTDAGKHNFYICAVGTTESETEGFVNGNLSANKLVITILKVAKQVEVRDNKLIITKENDGVVKYRVEIFGDEDDSDYLTLDIILEPDEDVVTIDFSEIEFSAGTYTIEVFSIGNDGDIIDSTSSYKLEGITKIDESSLGLTIVDGILQWDIDDNKTYDLYIDDILEERYKGLTGHIADLSGMTKIVTHKVQLVAHSDGMISSNKATIMVIKLPDVTNFKLTQTSLDNYTGEASYSFAWDSFGERFSGNTAMFYFEITPEPEIQPFNGKTENGATIALPFNYSGLDAGEYVFNIQAKGRNSKTESSGFAFGFVNGDKLANPITVTVLDRLEFVSYNRETNKVTITNTNTKASYIKIAYEYRNAEDQSQNKFVHTTTINANSTEFVLDYPADMDAGFYRVYFNPIGDIDNNILNASTVSYYDIQILSQVTNIRVNNGYLNWTHTGDEDTRYQIYVDGVLITYTTMEPDPDDAEAPEIEVTHTSFKDPAEARIVNEKIQDNLTHTITIKAIKENCIDSKFSNALKCARLDTINDANIKNSKLYWTSVANAEGYIIKLSNGDMATIFGESYNPDYDGIFVGGVNAGVEGYGLPTNMPSGSYGFYVVALGTTGDDNVPEGLVYLTGGQGNIASATVLTNTEKLYLDKGIINWVSVPNAVNYKFEIAKGEEITVDTSLSSFFTSGITRVSLEAERYESGVFYVVRVWAIGNGTTTLNSSTIDVVEMKVYKAPKPTNFKVVDGFISWEVPFGDSYIKYLNGGSILDDTAKSSLLNAAKSDDTVLSSNIAFYKTLEVTINDKVYSNQTVYSIEQTQNGLRYSYDFNFTKLYNPYTVKIRFIGTSTVGYAQPDNPDQGGDTGDDNVLEYSTNLSYKTKLFADEGEVVDPGADPGGEEPPQDQGSFINDEINVVSGNYSQEITGYKLSSPQTPIVGIKTMVENDCLYFTKVEATGFEERYLISVVDTTGELQDIEGLEINSSNIDTYKYSSSVYRVPVQKILEKVPESAVYGRIFRLNVRAMGTKDSSDSSVVNICFTSGYDHTCEVERLKRPDIQIFNGTLSVRDVATAVKQQIRIWSTSLGLTFDSNFDSDTNRANGKYAKEIIIDQSFDESNPHYPYVSRENEYIMYSLIDNPYFPQGEYYVTSKAIGNGIDKISSSESEMFEIIKRSKVVNATIDGGLFRWNHLKETHNGTVSEVSRYQITIIQYLEGVTNEETGELEPQSTTTKIIEVTPYLDEAKQYCYYDLDSLNFPASYQNSTCLYSIQVSAMGAVNTLDNASEEHYVSGDSTTSEKYKRLLPPQEVQMVNGRLTWKEVEGAVRYEVFKLNADGEEEDFGGYAIVKGDEGYRQLYFDGSEFDAGEAQFNIRIRAIPGSLTTTYLNGEFCVDICAKKLDMPDLRVEKGIVKWNTTDLSYEKSTGINIKVVKLTDSLTDDYVVYENANLAFDDSLTVDGYDILNSLVDGSKLPSGYYRIEIGFLGSNGYVTEPDEGEGGDNPSETEVQNISTYADGDDKTDPENPDKPTEPTDPDNLDQPQDPNNPDEDGTIKYCWFNSDIKKMVVKKYDDPIADLYIGGDVENPSNYISVELDPTAVYYQFTAIKYASDNTTIVKKYVFEAFDINTTSSQYCSIYHDSTLNKNFVLFNLEAVSAVDDPNAQYTFGQEFTIYCQAYGYDRSAEYTGGTIYSISNHSNYVAVEVPVTPTDLSVNTSTGVISWKNKSNNTMTKVKVYYNGSETPEYYSVEKGANTCKLRTIGSFSVSVSSYITSVNGETMYSVYSDAQTGTFNIFNSGSGTESDPYIITESKHLINIDYYLESYYKLDNNITMRSTEMQYITNYVIGREGQEFTGTLDGAGYSIKGIYFAYNSPSVAFINTIGTTGVVKNINIGIKTNTSSNYQATTFAGITITNKGTIDSVTTLAYSASSNGDGEIKYMAKANQSIAGIAYTNRGTITNTTNNMNIVYNNITSNMDTSVAGIVVYNYGTIEKSANTGMLYGSMVGGIADTNYGTINQCYNVGNMYASVGNTSGQARIGGIAVNNHSDSGQNGSITNCYVVVNEMVLTPYNNGAIPYIGGLVTDNKTQTLTNSYVVIKKLTITNSADKAVVGMITGVDSRKDSNFYSNVYYINLTGNTYSTLGSDSGVNVATRYNTSSDLASALTSVASTIYSADANNINGGYPIFQWQK